MVYRPANGDQASNRSAGQINMNQWSTYTPVWTNSGSAPTPNNAAINGRWRRDGTLIAIQLSLVIGSTTVLGTGIVRLGIPTGLSPGPMQQVGSAFWYDASTGILTRGVSILDPGVTYLYAWLGDSTTPSDAAGLASGDNIKMGGTFEVAA